MLATYPRDASAPSAQGGPVGIGGGNSRNVMFGFNIGDYQIRVEPQHLGDTVAFECPAKVLRAGAMAGSTFVPQNAGFGPHQDYLFIRDSTHWTYTTRAIVGAGAVVKIMPAGAQVGQEGEMILYKGATTLADIDNGNWSARLIRPFLINAADIANREAGWPEAGAAPTINVASKSVVDNNGNGYNHV